MNSENSKTSDPHRLLLNLSEKINLQRSDKYFSSSNLSIYYTWKNIKTSYKNNEFKRSAPTWNKKFELIDGSYCKHIIKNYEKVTENPPIRMYVSQIKNRITFRVKTGYYFGLLTPEMIKLLGSTNS